MSEAFALEYMERKLKQLGYKNYHLRYRDIALKQDSIEQIEAYNDLYCVLGEPQGVYIESSYGMYDATGAYNRDNIHLHRGEIRINNTNLEMIRIKFLQAIIVS